MNAIVETNIYQASIEDLDLIYQWTIKLHQHENDSKLEMHQNFHANLKRWLEIELNNPNSLFLIASLDELPAGFIFSSTTLNDNGFLAAPMKGIIHLLWVNQEFRKKNIAATLLDEVEKCLISIGVTYVECNYTAENLLAKSFWESKEYNSSSITAKKILHKKTSDKK